MEIKNEKVILRDYIESDIEDRIYWEIKETEWQLWDAPWEDEAFEQEQYRKEKLAWLEKAKDKNRIRWGFQICINDESKRHIGWCNAYNIDDNYEYTIEEGYCAIGINIPDLASRRKGYASAAWDLFIQYLLNSGVKNIYTQTWSGNERVMALMKKIGFEECNRERKKREVRGELYDGLTFKLNRIKYDGFRNYDRLKNIR